jgi:hypothetical protein
MTSHTSFSAAPALHAAMETANIAFAPSSPCKQKSDTKQIKKLIVIELDRTIF